MSKTSATIAFVLGTCLLCLLAGCAGDDTVNPLPPPDASTSDASKDASASDASKDASASDASKDASAGDGASAPDAAPDGA